MELKEIENIEVSPKDICVMLDFENPNSLSNLVKYNGFIRNTHGKYPVLANFKRKIEYIKELHQNEIKKIREQNSRGRLESAQAELKELELAKLKGELGSVTELEFAMKNEALLYKKGLEGLKTRLKIDLNLNPDQTEELEKQINGLLNQIANLPADTNAEFIIL